ncbi:hypothetical protein BDV3_002581 [Batrachochytrium dendrobatidis]|uniref:Extracellular metalloproteinase n=2 Tax=Batrachochytrium dendrobatidis TaxID=109871 RepID=A0A177WX81_BATDL|nr:hypothetical protein BDEG_27285 [Batrachochytrium dendrobatidis JEL423]
MFGSSITLVFALISTVAIAVPTKSISESISALPFHFPKSTYECFSESNTAILISPTTEESIKIGIDYLLEKLELDNNEFQVYNNFTDHGGVVHIYGAHHVNGARISNHHASVHVKNGQVTSYSASFEPKRSSIQNGLSVDPPTTKISFEQASSKASAKLNLPVYTKFKYEFEYIESKDGILVHTYKFQLRDDPLTAWLQVWVSTVTGDIVHAVDFSNKFSYNVIGLPRANPTDGFVVVNNPEYKASSPNGWTAGSITKGNNADVARRSNVLTPGVGRNGVFDTNFDPTGQPTSATNIQASAVNLFYQANMMHDIMYQYGFTEAAGNFQVSNFGKSGRGNDAVQINVMSSNKINNAEFYTPADGQPGVMYMYRFTSSNPNRDSGLDNTISLHEYGHGVSTRLTGGASTVQCLRTTEARGMGEGWSDLFAIVLTAKSTDTSTSNIISGAYASNRRAGIRMYPYTTNMNVNPLRYSNLRTQSEVHDIGEIWVTAMWEVYWNLVQKYGFSSNLHNAKQQAGNVIFLQNLIGGLMHQPCNPTFINARDAVLASDQAYYGGANVCEIWRGFAKRGFGVGARNFINDFTIPRECNTPSPPAPSPTRQATITPTVRPTRTTTVSRPTTTTKRSRPTWTFPGPNENCNSNNICCFFFGFDC